MGVRLAAVVAAAALASGAAHAQAEFALRAAVVKPAAAELRWRQIPWRTDLAAAQREARQQNRPLLLWASGDDPLERC